MNLMFWRRRDDDASTAQDRVLEQLSAYIDGELTEADAAEVESLIARDAAAAEVLGDLRLVRSAFGALGEVRAPRSFAIPAEPSARSARTPLALFRRTEMFMRASAAVAALFFLVAVVNDPGGTPVSNPTSNPTSNLAFDTAATTLRSAQGAAESGASLAAAEETQKGDGGAEIGATGLAAPAPADGDTSDDDGADGGAGNDVQPGGAPAPSADAPGGGAGGGMGGGVEPQGAEVQAEGARNTEELRPLATGTELLENSSQGAGGMALGLGALAALLAALSALTAWVRRSDGQTSQTR